MPPFHSGMRFRCTRECEMEGRIFFAGDTDKDNKRFQVVFQAGEVLVLKRSLPDFAKVMWLVPDRHTYFESQIVSESDQQDSHYRGYAVRCPFDIVGRDIELFRDAPVA